mmetsp:Transcript_30064/g.68920  ORF Transcript_30064/g.68920 Transcript_30064/m.68920 type:complete len:250 (-) Transcript_30064:1923-2672(-)
MFQGDVQVCSRFQIEGDGIVATLHPTKSSMEAGRGGPRPDVVRGGMRSRPGQMHHLPRTEIGVMDAQGKIPHIVQHHGLPSPSPPIRAHVEQQRRFSHTLLQRRVLVPRRRSKEQTGQSPSPPQFYLLVPRETVLEKERGFGGAGLVGSKVHGSQSELSVGPEDSLPHAVVIQGEGQDPVQPLVVGGVGEGSAGESQGWVGRFSGAELVAAPPASLEQGRSSEHGRIVELDPGSTPRLERDGVVVVEDV